MKLATWLSPAPSPRWFWVSFHPRDEEGGSVASSHGTCVHDQVGSSGTVRA